eukprot:7946598-Lingulodinium_polyedra.AAC.1
MAAGRPRVDAELCTWCCSGVLADRRPRAGVGAFGEEAHQGGGRAEGCERQLPEWCHRRGDMTIT